MINELKLIENIGLLFESQVVLFGAGREGKKTYSNMKRLGIPIAYFCDSDDKKWGTFIEKIEIISPRKLVNLDKVEVITIIIATHFVKHIEEIAAFLAEQNFRTDNIFTLVALDITISQSLLDEKTNKNYPDSFIGINSKINEVRKLCETFKHYQMLCQRLLSCLEGYQNDPNHVLVFQSGKTGSSTISHSLAVADISNTHIHDLAVFNNPTAFRAPDHVLDALRTQKSVKIITLVREPFSTALSRVFQAVENLGIRSIISQYGTFMNFCLYGLEVNTPMLFDWFDNELKAVFDVDVFAHPFDRESGYSIIKQDNIEVLVLKLEKLNSLETVIREFVGASHFKLINANEMENRSAKFLYNSIKERIKIPRKLFNDYYIGNAKIDHFYSEDEKEVLKKKWESNIVSD